MLRDVPGSATRVVLPVLGVLTLLAACGEPPRPALTALPNAPGGASVAASGYPAGPVPTGSVPLPTAGVPTAGVPTGVPTYPTAGVPTYPTTTYPTPRYPTTTPPPATTTPPTGPSPAARCTNGPTQQQMSTVVQGYPGIPAKQLKVIEGPFCAGSWQFATLEIVATDAGSRYEPLLVVTKGKPDALVVIEAGADVCSVMVQNEAPPRIRVRACGA